MSVLTFSEFVAEGATTYPTWVKLTAAAMVFKIRNLSLRIHNEEDPVKQNELIAQQNKLLAYISGLGIAVSTNDKQMMAKMRG